MLKNISKIENIVFIFTMIFGIISFQMIGHCGTFMYETKRDCSVCASDYKVGMADLIPFIYYEVNDGTDDLSEIAEYAYVALIEGWFSGESEKQKIMWKHEYEKVFNKEYDSGFSNIKRLV